MDSFGGGTLWLTQGHYGPQSSVFPFCFSPPAAQKSPPQLEMGGGTWGP